MKIGVQMYSIRNVTSQDMERALQRVAEIGYEGIEFAGFYDYKADEILSWLKKYNLEVLGAHVSTEMILDQPDETIEFHKRIGNKRIICPGFEGMKTKEGVLDFAKRLAAVIPKYHQAGMRLYYHNHAFEFTKEGEDYLIDVLFDQVELLSPEFDIFWVYAGGECPVDYLNKYQGKTDIVHIKDGIGNTATLLGKGEVNLEGVCSIIKKHHYKWAVVESESSDEMNEQIQAIKYDFGILKELLK
ncbi:sugar phosphate isomerase/epimerase family protein [Vallitalea okinawensis]|uniref:sugar phosphate isomerase/epimerase family protein n=1 Tax=Vallitalea okinawensis TaxID=2078660 RepID=UPI000CFC36DC|nr:TIM barrel protein [Vallitalea okinawensis]